MTRKTLLKVGDMVRVRRAPYDGEACYSKPSPPWSECPVEFGDTGVITKVWPQISRWGDGTLYTASFFRWPDEDLRLSAAWLEKLG